MRDAVLDIRRGHATNYIGAGNLQASGWQVGLHDHGHISWEAKKESLSHCS